MLYDGKFKNFIIVVKIMAFLNKISFDSGHKDLTSPTTFIYFVTLMPTKHGKTKLSVTNEESGP